MKKILFIIFLLFSSCEHTVTDPEPEMPPSEKAGDMQLEKNSVIADDATGSKAVADTVTYFETKTIRRNLGYGSYSPDSNYRYLYIYKIDKQSGTAFLIELTRGNVTDVNGNILNAIRPGTEYWLTVKWNGRMVLERNIYEYYYTNSFSDSINIRLLDRKPRDTNYGFLRTGEAAKFGE
jgi:hypothetical protein